MNASQIFKADFSCPNWFSTSAKKLIKRILDPNPQTVSCFCSKLSQLTRTIFHWTIQNLNNESEIACTPDDNAATLQRIAIPQIIENEWFKKGYQLPQFETADVNLGDVDAIFDESEVEFTHPQLYIH